MSGTSLDGIDAIIVDLSSHPHILATHYQPYNDLLRQKLRRLCQGCDNELALFSELDTQLGVIFAEAANCVLEKAKIDRAQVRAIGNHGQTIRHYPDKHFPNSLQIGNPNIIAEYTQITTIADFRRRDIAAKGQGAPLVPAFHKAVFSHPAHYRAIINIGGIANATFLPPTHCTDELVSGFDIGPGNTLMDTWIYRHKRERQDHDGHWANKGQSNQALLQAILADPYFSAPPPKSTGSEYFNMIWLEGILAKHPDIPVNVQATLCEVTATSIANTINSFETTPTELFICGGGNHNSQLMQQLRDKLPGASVATTEVLGIDPDWVEAAAFAWLAQQTLENQAGNLPAVTGANKSVKLGSIYPA